MRPPRQLNDRVMRDTLRDPANLRDFLRVCVPELADHFDYSAMRDRSRDFFTADWRGREADVLCEMPLRMDDEEEWVLVCVLIEHLTQADPVASLRAIFNVVGYWDRHWRAWEQIEPPREALQLPPVVPIILHTGQRPWNTTRTVRGLVTGPEQLRLLAPDWGPVYWDLAGRSADELMAGGLWVQLLAVMRVAGADRTEFERVLAAVTARLASAQTPEHVRALEVLRAAILHSITRRPEIPRDELRALVERASAPRQQEVTTMVRTIGEAWDQEALVRALRRMISQKFGSVPPQVAERLESIRDTDRLESLACRMLTIDTLDQLFQEDTQRPS